MMHKQRVLQPVIQLSLLGESSDCVHFFLLLSLIGFFPLFLDCYVFDLSLPPPPLPPHFSLSILDQRSRAGREGRKGGVWSLGHWLVYKGLSMALITSRGACMHSEEPHN